MSESGRGELHQLPGPAVAEDQPTADETHELSESKLNQALEQLDQQPEYQIYIREAEALEGAKIDYENAWTAFLHTVEGRHYNESNQRYQSAKNHYQRTREKVADTYHFQNYTVAEDHRTESTQKVATAEEQAVANPQYRQTADYQQINQRHQSILDRCRQAWHDLSHTLEGKAYHRAKTQLDKAEREVSLAWAGGSQIPQGQRLIRITEQIAQLEQSCQQAEQTYKQTPAYAEYAQAAEAHRQLALAKQSESTPVEQAKIIPIGEASSRSRIHSVRGLSAAA